MIAIIDYGMGNLRSVYNAFQAIGSDVRIAEKPAQLRNAKGIVLPGVGAFGDGMNNLHTRGFVDELNSLVISHKRPFLGICLGLQFLGSIGYEHGENPGLGWISGPVEKIVVPDGLRLPHIGWNDVHFSNREGLFRGLGATESFYFVHSFALRAEDSAAVSGICNYGVDFVASIEHENVSATQFHPEKSHKKGLSVLKNWSETLVTAC